MASSSDDEPPTKRLKKYYADFDEEEFVDSSLIQKQEKKKCCGREWLTNRNKSIVKTHKRLLDFYLSLKPSGIRNRVFRDFDVLTGSHCIDLYPSSAADATALAAVHRYIYDITASNRRTVLSRMGRSDGKHTEDADHTEKIVVFPSQYSKRTLHIEYNLIQSLSALHICFGTLFCSATTPGGLASCGVNT
eukprot:IDg16347t1